MSWIPTLFVNSGYERAEGIAALTLYSLGAVAGIVLIGLIATKIKLAKPIAIYFIGSALFLAVVAYWQPTSVFWLNTLIFTIGFLLQGAFTAMYAMAARVYPTSVRATGIGWAAGLGRIGGSNTESFFYTPVLARRRLLSKFFTPHRRLQTHLKTLRPCADSSVAYLMLSLRRSVMRVLLG
ncbi:hypothetical protein NNA33_09715 [Marisediminitalea aggregata]|uniref:MFS transporter n=1 Tax=Marisediminitalea aggregata TaxID=634436 RepID=UPI0020CED9F1|nr:MFS transporter [Marisediminitalea aggregata]MCP9478199.1 hypothetical protein [Marisediminitalea aggregata]